MKLKFTNAQRHLALLCFMLFLSSLSSLKAQEKYYRVNVKASQVTWGELLKKGFTADHFYSENGTITAELSEKEVQVLKENKIPFTIKIRNLAKRIPKRNKRIDKRAAKKSTTNAAKATNLRVVAPQNFELGSMGGFPTLDEMIATLDRMKELYPDLITVKSSIGNSIENRPIYSVKISDNADIDEDEEEMLFTALHHAREPMGLAQMLFYMWHLLENYATDSEIKTLVDHTELYFVPVVNPDGYRYNQQTNPNGGGFWRKNRRQNQGGSIGVDPNRNYGYRWGTAGNNPNGQTYQGPAAFSEPETTAMKDFCNNHEFIAALNYHSFANVLIHPFGYAVNTFTPDQELFVKMCTYMTEENNFNFGTPSQTLGGVAASGSHDDWMYAEQTSKPKTLAMAPEVGTGSDGFWPASSRIIPLCEEVFPFNLKLTRMIAKYAKLTPNETTQTITETDGAIAFAIQRFSINQAEWEVTLTSSSNFVSNVGAPKKYGTIPLLETENDEIAFELNSNTPQGTSIPMSFTVSNGSWSYNQDITVIYEGNGTSNPSPVDGGSISTGDDSTAVTTLTGDGIADIITFQNTSTTTAAYAYLITDDAGNILALETSSHDFEGSSIGICRVYGISYVGNLTITGKNISDQGLATGDFNISENRIIVTRTDGTTSPNPTGQTAFSNHSIPGIIQAEDYDIGGEGIAYSDTDVRNNGTRGRIDEGVDIENTIDAGQGLNVGWMANGEWLEYTIKTVRAGTYDLIFRVASVSGAAKSVTAKLGGTNLGSVAIPNTGGWQNWQEVVIEDVTISSNQEEVLRLEIIGGGYNINWFQFRSEGQKAQKTETALEHLTLFPNPAQKQLQVRFEKVIKQGVLSIYDNLGRTIETIAIHNAKEYTINVAAFSKGIYHIGFFEDDLLTKNATFIKK